MSAGPAARYAPCMSDTDTPLLLLVEDDTRLADLLRQVLEKAGFRTAHEARGDRAVERILDLDPDLVILDLGLPGADGLDVCRDVRGRYRGRILVLTARGDEIDEVVGLELGADGYLGKPVAPRRLLAHVRALLRRPDVAADPRVRSGPLCIDPTRRSVEVDGRPVDLTTAEFDALWVLAQRMGTVVDREVLSRELRGLAYDGIDRSLDLRVSRLRKKLGEHTPLPLIQTVHGQGYQLVQLP